MDIFYRFFLAFSHSTLILPLIIIGYIWLDRKNFFHATCLLLINVIFNFALKASFKIPLSPTVGEGFAFPSGHMQATIVFYGWLLKSTPNLIIRGCILTLFIGVAFGLVHFGYHNHFDTIGAIFFGTLLIFVYNYSLQHFKSKLLLGIIFFSTLLMIYIYLIHELKGYTQISYTTLLGFVIAEGYFKDRISLINYRQKLFATGFYILIVILCHKIFSMATISFFTNALKGIILGFFLPFSAYLASTGPYKMLKLNAK